MKLRLMIYTSLLFLQFSCNEKDLMKKTETPNDSYDLHEEKLAPYSYDLLLKLVEMTPSPEREELIDQFGFTENPKREKSWGSSYGAYLQERENKLCLVLRIMRTPDPSYAYYGELPFGINHTDSRKTINNKFGDPREIRVSEYMSTWVYDGFELVFVRDRVFEVRVTHVPKP